jgi:hypothetical protein
VGPDREKIIIKYSQYKAANREQCCRRYIVQGILPMATLLTAHPSELMIVSVHSPPFLDRFRSPDQYVLISSQHITIENSCGYFINTLTIPV